MRRSHLLGLLGLLAAISPRAATSQSAPTLLHVGQSHYGSLVTYDQRIWGRGRFKTYWVDLLANRSYRFTMESATLDSYVTLARMVNGVTEVLAEDDDSGGGTHASLSWTAPASGRYLVVAQSYRPDDTGSFTLRVNEGAAPPPPAPPAPVSLRIGQSVAGQLGRGDLVLSQDDSYYDAYEFYARRGQRLIVEMRSTALDAYLHVGRGTTTSWETLVTDNNGLGRGYDSRIRFLVPVDGAYMVYANSNRGGEAGPYTLGLAEAPPPPRAVPRPLAWGSPVSGTIDHDDPIFDGSWTYYDLYSFEAAPGQRVEFEAASRDFAATLEVGTLASGRFTRLARATAPRAGAAAVVRPNLTQGGTYYLRVNPGRNLETGGYTLAARTAPPTQPARIQPAPVEPSRPSPGSEAPVTTDSAASPRPEVIPG